jgi:hypothetical protein
MSAHAAATSSREICDCYLRRTGKYDRAFVRIMNHNILHQQPLQALQAAPACHPSASLMQTRTRNPYSMSSVHSFQPQQHAYTRGYQRNLPLSSNGLLFQGRCAILLAAGHVTRTATWTSRPRFGVIELYGLFISMKSKWKCMVHEGDAIGLPISIGLKCSRRGFQ